MKITLCLHPRYLFDFYKVLCAYTYQFSVSDMGAESVYIDFETDGNFNVREFAREVRDADFMRKYDSYDVTVNNNGDYEFYRIADYNAYHDDGVTLLDVWEL